VSEIIEPHLLQNINPLVVDRLTSAESRSQYNGRASILLKIAGAVKFLCDRLAAKFLAHPLGLMRRQLLQP
jgi:hypothetical protein